MVIRNDPRQKIPLALAFIASDRKENVPMGKHVSGVDVTHAAGTGKARAGNPSHRNESRAFSR
jgi:hypothetical protein